jgi:hypothetical protein
MPQEAQQEDFASLGLFDELQDADCVELFADVFRDAANLEIGDQVLLEALNQDWWDDEPGPAAPASAAEPLKAAPSVAPAAFAPVHAPLQPAAATYKSLTAQIAIVAPCLDFPAAAMPNMMMMGSLPAMPAVLPAAATAAPVAAAPAGGFVADFAELDMYKLDTRARRQIAIARWKDKRKRRNFGEKHRFPEYDCRRKVANRRPRVNGRFIREQPVYVSISELQATHQL